jgi:hypothetical protein
MKKMFQFIYNLFITKKECKHDEVCPIYLAYLDKYKDDSKEIKYCKNSNKQFCTKYNLINQTTWKTLSKDEKIKLIKDMNLIDFIDKN